MQAIVKEKRAPGLTVKSVPKPSPGPGEVLIAVRHAGVCGTDLHIADWNPWAQGRIKPPIVVGHEFAGEIESVGDGVTGLRAGHLVTAEGHIVCGHCLQCRTGNSHICKNTRIIGVDRDGAFAEYIVMPATNVLTLDGGNIPTEVGAIMDPMGNAFHTVLTAEIPGSTVFVVGCGPIGCFAVGIARAAGATKVIASDVNPTRLALAEKMGAHVTINAKRDDVVKTVLAETAEEGADVVCEMSGVPSALHQAFRTAKSRSISPMRSSSRGSPCTASSAARCTRPGTRCADFSWAGSSIRGPSSRTNSRSPRSTNPWRRFARGTPGKSFWRSYELHGAAAGRAGGVQEGRRLQAAQLPRLTAGCARQDGRARRGRDPVLQQLPGPLRRP